MCVCWGVICVHACVGRGTGIQVVCVCWGGYMCACEHPTHEMEKRGPPSTQSEIQVNTKQPYPASLPWSTTSTMRCSSIP